LATAYNIKRALVPGGPYTVIGTSAASPYTDTTGVSGTAYYYVVSSTNACGESAGNSIESHATPIYASFLVTTTGAQTLTIARLTVSAAMIVDWGDGTTDSYNGQAARTHNYAGAGTWTVRFLAPLLVTWLWMGDPKMTVNSGNIAPCKNTGSLIIGTTTHVTFNSTDVSSWSPHDFELTGAVGWTGNFNFSDVSAWSPIMFLLQSMPIGYTIVITAGLFAAWTKATAINMSNDALTQSQVNQILTDCYTAFATRTATGGIITLNGASNAAPSGIFQAQCPPTTGKERAFELLNDSCTINPTKKWSTITTN
jgi:hypothetical protein